MSNAHPMVLPHVPRDAKELEHLSDDARRVYALLYDMVEGFVSDQPNWQIRRYLIRLDDALFATQENALIEPGWRAMESLASLPEPSSGLPETPKHAELDGLQAVVRKRELRDCPSPPMSLGDFIAHMEQGGLGRPSTYANHAQGLLDRGFVNSLRDVRLTNEGKRVLEKLRSKANQYDANFTKKFIKGLDAIEAGTCSAKDCFDAWLDSESAKLATTWLDGFDIEGDLASLFYEDRDEIDRSTVYWPPGLLPKELDPEQVLPVDSNHRTFRAELNKRVAEEAGHEWQQYSTTERVEKRIKMIAREEQLSSTQWRTKYRFDLLQRWIVGWYMD